MEHLATSRKLVAELAREELIEARRPDAVGRDLAGLVQRMGRPPTGAELEQWLEEHRLISEVYAGPDALDEIVHRHLGPAFAQAAPLAEARHPELEAALAREPDSVEHYLVYSDWLQERSDPLGELIALGVAADGGDAAAQTRFERQLKQHEERFLGAIARLVPDQVELTWRCGLVHGADVRVRMEPRVWQELLGLRVCQLLHTLKVDLSWSYEPASTITALTEIEGWAPATLRALWLNGAYELLLPGPLQARRLEELALVGSRATLPERLPDGLERLRLRVRELVCPEPPRRWDVRELELRPDAEGGSLVAGIELPRLERLCLWVSRCPGPVLLELLRRIQAPRLRHLELQRGQLDASTVLQLARLPLVGRLESLGLTRLGLGDATLKQLARQGGRLPALERLDLSDNELTREGLEAAQELGPELVSRRQERPGSAAHQRLRRFAGSRLQVANTIADPRLWRDAGVDGELLWGRYRGTEDYELFVTRDLGRHGCSCPSSIQPCKHVVALVLVAEQHGLPAAPSGGIERRVRSYAGHVWLDDELT